MEMSLADLRSDALDRIKRKFNKPGVVAQPHIGVVLRKGTLVWTVTVYDHELEENKDRLDKFIDEKMYDAAQLMRVPLH